MMKKFWIAVIASMAFLVQPMAAEICDDGLHKTAWMRDTFKDLSEDLEEATAEGKRLMVIVEQRGLTCSPETSPNFG